MSRSDPTAGIVIIGAEVLSGKVNDENAPFLLRTLRERGVRVVEIRTIGDDINEIAKAVRALARKVDHLFTTGGIGPTHDDVTIAGIARAFDRTVVLEPEVERRLRRRFGAAINAAHLKMAEVPEGAKVTLDDATLVPIIECANVVVLPGVPSLMRACFARVAKNLMGTPFCSRALLLDTAEPAIAEHLAAVQARYPEVAIGSYPRFDDAPYRVKVTVDGRDPTLVDEVIGALRKGIAEAVIVGHEP